MDHLIFSPKLDESNPFKKFAVLIALKIKSKYGKKIRIFHYEKFTLKVF